MTFIFFHALGTEFTKTQFYYAGKTAKDPLYEIFFLPKALLNNLHPVKKQLTHHLSTLLT